ncbi:MAG TPA: hypothetical protein VGN37_10030 [Actinocatenispora sp.]
MNKATMEQSQAERDAVPDLLAEDEPERRRRGRRLLFVGVAGVVLVGMAWTLATVRTGMAAMRDEKRNRKGRNRNRRH